MCIRPVLGAGFAALVSAQCSWFTGSDAGRDPRLVWERPFVTQGSHTTPLVVDSLVIFATRSGMVVAVDRRTGVIRWERSLLPGQDILAKVLATASGRVLVPAIRVVALSLADGAEAWTFDAPPDDPGDESIVVADTIAVVTGALGWLYAIDTRTGAEHWRRNIGERPFGLVADRGQLFFGTRSIHEGALGAGHLLALNAADNTEAWRIFVPDRPGSTFSGGSIGFPATLEDRAIFSTVSGFLYAVDRATGDTLWTHDSGQPWHWYFGGPVIVAGRIIAVRYDGLVVGLDAVGKRLWTQRLNSPPSRATTDGERLFVSDGQLRAIASDGRVMWSYPRQTGEEPNVIGPPTVADGVVYAVTAKGFIAVRDQP